jgi:1-pyrroline-5-carboxylate dehydrogenase
MQRRSLSYIRSWTTVDPFANESMVVHNRVNGIWSKSAQQPIAVPDPLNSSSKPLQLVQNTSLDEIQPFLESLASCRKSGLHNPLKNPQRFIEYGQICHRVAEEMDKPEVEQFFAKLIQRVMPKSWAQCVGEVKVTKTFLKSFSGDSVRFNIGRGFSVPGDHAGQESRGYRWPFGPVAVISPFNFPLEIPALQSLGAVLAGNRVVVKPAEKVAVVYEQFLRLMLACGAPLEDIMILNGSGHVAEAVVTSPIVRLTQFTGSSQVANKLSEKTKGKCRLEDAGYNWKILGPKDKITSQELDYVSYVCDQDAYAASGQKCSAQSCLFVHSDWTTGENDIVSKLKSLASRRSFKDLTIGPLMSVTTDRVMNHIENVLSNIPNAKLAFGGNQIKEPGAELVPKQYGMVNPTGLRCRIGDVLSSQKAFDIFQTEIFGPFQFIVDYESHEVDLVLQCMEKMDHHLTAAIVSSNPTFCNKILANTVNGTTYVGLRARTTGAPTNHWFGPAGDPRGAGIGSIESIIQLWTCHREIVHDVNEPTSDWLLPKPS